MEINIENTKGDFDRLLPSMAGIDKEIPKPPILSAEEIIAIKAPYKGSWEVTSFWRAKRVAKAQDAKTARIKDAECQQKLEALRAEVLKEAGEWLEQQHEILAEDLGYRLAFIDGLVEALKSGEMPKEK